MRLRPVLLAVFGCACSGKDTGSSPYGSGTVVDSGQAGEGEGETEDLRGDCPVGMVQIPALTGELGEDDPVLAEQYAGQVVLAREFTLDGYCIDRFPFPGQGLPWTVGDLDWGRVEAFAALAEAHGRRLCTVAELMHAAAGEENWRYPYDRLAYRDDRCEPADLTPTREIGAYERCESPYGVRDFMVRSAWGVLDEQAGEDIRAFYETDTGGTLIPGGGVYAVWGGSAVQDTFYAPNNYGLHFYGPDDPGYVNESLRACADVGRLAQGVEDDWATVVDDFVAAGGDWSAL